ncbi:MAG: Pantothenate synthetase [Fibrobacteres bacterium]|nr:Pantothenate synthetase [Fibrobacterota bacterium]
MGKKQFQAFRGGAGNGYAGYAMEIIKTVGDYRVWRKDLGPDLTVGFVPTMGALHAGHMKLVETSGRANDITVVSIFVNPLQFGPAEDFSRYPRPFEADSLLCREAGVAAIFAPEAPTFYPPDFSAYCEVPGPDRFLDGASRPGHFRGVCTVVLKLFNIVNPDRAYFGQKDIQQALILRKLVRDFSLDLELEIVETVREATGLALSSRNVYLTPDEKSRATALSRGLFRAKEAWTRGEKSAETLKAMMRSEIEASSPTRIDYIEAVSQADLAPAETLSKPSVLAVAVFYGKTRLIDNVLLD